MTYLYEKAATPSSGLRLHLNENTGGCSPAVLDALRQLTAESIAFYPDYSDAIAVVAARFDVDSRNLVLCNGLDEGILAASIAAVRTGTSATVAPTFRSGGNQPEAIVVVPAFDMQAACADAAGARVVEVPLRTGFEFPTSEVIGAITPETRIIFITTPHNPSGTLAPREAVLEIAAAAPDAMVFVDEAYADFSGVTLIGDPSLAKFPNIVIGRTFAKAYGLAALRCGALIGSPDVLARISRVLPPYSINVAAAVALPAALRDRAYYDWYLREVEESKTLLYALFDRLRIPYWRSGANFVLARLGPDVTRICAALAERGIYIRDRSKIPGCEGCVRITTGIVEHTRKCIEGIEEVLCAAQ